MNTTPTAIIRETTGQVFSLEFAALQKSNKKDMGHDSLMTNNYIAVKTTCQQYCKTSMASPW